MNMQTSLHYFNNEIKILRQLAQHPHPGIFRLLKRDSISMFFPLYEMDLKTLIRQLEFDEASTKYVFFIIVKAVHWLHSHSIFHRDLKSSNNSST
jgi:serine/threonine protein kinase